MFSAELSTLDQQQNDKRTKNLMQCLEDCNIKFSKAQGYYKGTSEKTFIVVPKNTSEVETIKNFCFNNFGQESILYQDTTGNCYLEFSTGETMRIGRLKQVNPKLIEMLDNYTIFNGRVFTTEKV